MNRKWLLLASIVVYIVIFVILFVSNKEEGIEIQHFERYDNYLESIGLNPDDFITSQKQTISDHNFEFVKEFVDSDYIAPSIRDVFFERDWGVASEVDWDKEADINPDIYLFQQANFYYMFGSFTVPYHFDTNMDVLGYLDIGYSLNYNVEAYYAISYLEDGIQYRLQNSRLEFIQDTTQLPIYKNKESFGGMIKPDLIYTFTITFTPSVDNDLEDDMYLNTDFDFYMINNNNPDLVQIGFNQFKDNSNHSKYYVKRKSVVYDRGNE